MDAYEEMMKNRSNFCNNPRYFNSNPYCLDRADWDNFGSSHRIKINPKEPVKNEKVFFKIVLEHLKR